ncbi:unnamed protein product, partial [Staurois parvus]
MPHISAYQCTSMPHISAHLSCLSMSPISANQCHLSVLPISATYRYHAHQCHLSVSNSTAYQCPSLQPHWRTSVKEENHLFTELY